MPGKRVLIVGGVAGGASCAARLRRLDEEAEIFVFERGPEVSFANCGMPYYVGGVIREKKQLLVASPEQFRDWFNVEVRTRCEVQSIDRQAKTVTVQNVHSGETATEAYDALVLAPGAAPIRPPLQGIDSPGIFTLRNLQELDGIVTWIDRHQAQRAVVVGGGFIGLEMAENLILRGLDVTIVERLDQVMPPMDAEMVSPVHGELKSKGVELQLGTEVTRFDQAANETINVVTKNHRQINTDMVILAVGVRPEVKLAQEAGLEIGSLGGIRVDPQMVTSDPSILAVGDAVEVRHVVTGQWTLIPLAGPANRQGRTAADVIAGRDAQYRGSQGTAVVGVFDLTLAATGASEKMLVEAGMAYQKTYTHSDHHAGYYPGAETIAMKLLFDPQTGRVLGAQAVGKAGVEKRIDVLAMAIQKEATVYDLEEAELCYAPQYGSAKDPVNMAGFVAANILRDDVDIVHWPERPDSIDDPDSGPLVIDVRTPREVSRGAIPGTLNIPLGELRFRLKELPRDREIWVHCGVGQRSYYASRILKQHGFKVRHLSGGMLSFKMNVR